MTDNGLPAAQTRVRAARVAHTASIGCCEPHVACCSCGFHPISNYRQIEHMDDEIARAAREDYGDLVASVTALRADVAETVREAKYDALREYAADLADNAGCTATWVHRDFVADVYEYANLFRGRAGEA